MSDNSAAAREALMSTPPAAVLGMTIAGVSLQDWVCVATLAWLALQTGWFIYSKYPLLFNKGKKDGEE